MTDDKRVQTPSGFIDIPAATPEIFADAAVNFQLLNGVVKIALGSVRIVPGKSAESADRVVVGRVVTSVRAAQRLAFELSEFLKKQGFEMPPSAEKTKKENKSTKMN